MIISHHYKFIFFALPKTASQSIRLSLRPHLHELDWEQCNLFESRRFPMPALAKYQTGHLNYQQIQHFFYFELLKQYFKFCFFRDPIDRFLSFYFFTMRNKKITSNWQDEIKINYLNQPEKLNKHILSRPQFSFITDESGELKMDFIGRFSQLKEDFQHLFRLLKLPETPLCTINASQNSKKCVIDQELEDFLRNFYDKDYQIIEQCRQHGPIIKHL